MPRTVEWKKWKELNLFFFENVKKIGAIRQAGIYVESTFLKPIQAHKRLLINL